jgi:DNA-binding transcriptional regulator LsrR (DeoR family)
LNIEEMDADGMTQREIADELGISAASVCRILKGNGAAA